MITNFAQSASTIKERGRETFSLLLTYFRDRRRIVNILTAVVLFIGIAGFGACQHTRLARYMSITYAVIAALGLQLSLRSLPAGLFLMWTAFILYCHPSTPILAALTAVLYAGGVLAIANSQNFTRTIMNGICIYALANVLWQLLQLPDYTVGYNPIYTGPYTLVGLQTNVGEMSALVAVCMPAFCRRGWAWFIPVPFTGLILAGATVGVMSSAAVCLVYVFGRILKKQGRILGFAILGVIAAMVAIHVTVIDPFAWEDHKNSRLQTWKESVVIALGKPVRGQGFGQFSTMVPLLSTPLQLTVEDRLRLYDDVEDKEHFKELARTITKGDAAAYYKNKPYPNRFFFEAHNDYIEALFAGGIPELVFLLGALAHILRRGWKQESRIPFYGLLASCVGATTWFIWQIVPIAVVTVAWAGLCLAGRDE